MVDTSGGDFVSPGFRYFARIESGSPAQIGAYLPDYSGDVTVYWRGHVGRETLQSIIGETETVLTRSGQKVVGTFDAYGIDSKDPDETERHIGPVQVEPLKAELSKRLASTGELPDFDACRAELTVSQGKVIIWANVSGDETAALEEGGENIGVSVPQLLFKQEIRSVIEHAISITMELKPPAVLKLLNDISIAIQTRALRPG